MSQRHAVTKKMAVVYKRLRQSRETKVLDDLVGLTRRYRDYARRQLKATGTAKLVTQLRPRTPRYSAQLSVAFAFVWSLSRYPAGRRLSSMLKTLVVMLRCDGDLLLGDEDAALLVAMSAATIDRYLKSERVRLGLKGRSRTKPGTLLES